MEITDRTLSVIFDVENMLLFNIVASTILTIKSYTNIFASL